MIRNIEHVKRLESITHKDTNAVVKKKKVLAIGYSLGQKEALAPIVRTNVFNTNLRMWMNEHIFQNHGDRRLRDTAPLDTDVEDTPIIQSIKSVTVTFRSDWMDDNHSQILRSTSVWRKGPARYDYCVLKQEDMMIVRLLALFTVTLKLTQVRFKKIKYHLAYVHRHQEIVGSDCTSMICIKPADKTFVQIEELEKLVQVVKDYDCHGALFVNHYIDEYCYRTFKPYIINI